MAMPLMSVYTQSHDSVLPRESLVYTVQRPAKRESHLEGADFSSDRRTAMSEAIVGHRHECTAKTGKNCNIDNGLQGNRLQ